MLVIARVNKKFHRSLRGKIVQCNISPEAWPNKNINVDDTSHVCTRCKINKGTLKKLSADNNMDSGSVYPELNDITRCEEMLIARAFPVMQVYVRKKDIIRFPTKNVYLYCVVTHNRFR